MKKMIFLFSVLLLSLASVHAQSKKWADLTAEEQMLKAKEFREDNQKFLKGLGLTDDQLIDVDNVNACYTFSLERINNYGKDDATKQKWAKTATQARQAQMDMIMGPENRAKFEKYITEKAQKIQAASKQ